MLRSNFKGAELPLIFQFAQIARNLSGVDGEIISLEQGQADFQPPDAVKKEAQNFIKEKPVHYTTIDGLTELKAKIAAKYQRENNLDVKQERISVGAGGSQIIFEALAVTLSAGDEVIVPTPYWPSFVQGIQVNNGKPIFIETALETGFKFDAQQLEHHISSKTKWLILNSPGNPAGGYYSAEELHEICLVLDRYPNLLVMFDEIYEHMLFDNKVHQNILNIRPDLKERVLLVNGVSKSYSMTGWRIGYGIGPVELINAMKLYRSASTSSPSSVSQIAALKALDTPLVDLKKQSRILEFRRNDVLRKLNDINGLECGTPDGAMYVFPRCKQLLGTRQPNRKKIVTDIDFCEYLIFNAGVSTVPGTALGLPGYFRMNFALKEKVLDEAIARITKAVSQLS
ncbi:pyridoxal phosphate-dependent aminotransferase [Kiloniella sp. EL199]|uniref:pyridoxal phosphate-dependent aminotransferase n=1 Tax=Kiloniella sp. EL199 TaxID=2107581 RepID=UPI001C1FD0C4|nr:pyridoxal phosphate-dependent aminotransferase [Kiloniella sp. EL199]